MIRYANKDATAEHPAGIVSDANGDYVRYEDARHRIAVLEKALREITECTDSAKQTGYSYYGYIREIARKALEGEK